MAGEKGRPARVGCPTETRLATPRENSTVSITNRVDIYGVYTALDPEVFLKVRPENAHSLLSSWLVENLSP